MDAKPRLELPFLLPSLPWLLDAMSFLLKKCGGKIMTGIHAGHADIELA
jgi:hypothetical protein